MKKTKRLHSIDLLRGIFITLMTLGHAAYFIAKISHNEFWNAAFLIHENSAWAYIRIITYIGAPGFFFLMGTGITLLTASRLKSKWPHIKINKFLTFRGTFIIAIAILLITPVWTLSINIFSPLLFDALICLGACMIITSLLTRVSTLILSAITLLGIIIPYTYVNSLPLWHTPNFIASILAVPYVSQNLSVYFPIFPWLSLCLLGAIWARFYIAKTPNLIKTTRNIGIFLLILFIISRLLNIGNFHAPNYGDFLSFFLLIKYPASISYILFTVGINLILLSALSKIKSISPKNPLIVFGKAPLFFYITHLYLYLILGLLFPNITSLLLTLTIWATGLIILYYSSKEYAKFKFKKDVNSIWGFF